MGGGAGEGMRRIGQGSDSGQDYPDRIRPLLVLCITSSIKTLTHDDVIQPYNSTTLMLDLYTNTVALLALYPLVLLEYH